MKISLKTATGNYLTAVNGGGMGDPSGMPFNSVPMHTNATESQAWEVFTFIPQGRNVFALQTSAGNHITAVNGGGMGDPPGMEFNSIPFHTNATVVSDWETFELVPISPHQNKFALKTAAGHFVTAINGGGMVDPAGQAFNSWPIHTDSTRVQAWEKFELEPALSPSRTRSYSSDAEKYLPLAKKLKGKYAAFKTQHEADLRSLKKAVNNSTPMDAVTKQGFQNIAQSDFVQSAKTGWQHSKTVSLAFEVDAHAVFGAGLGGGIAFDWDFSRYMIFLDLYGSFGFAAGGGLDVRVGLHDFDVFKFNGLSDSVGIEGTVGIGVGVAWDYSFWTGPGIDFIFSAGAKFNASAAIGYTHDLGHGTI